MRFCRFPWGGHQNHAIGLMNELVVLGGNFFRKPQLFQFQNETFAVEYPHHKAFAEKRRNGRHPEINLLVGYFELDPSVLGQAPLGDIEFGHDLDPRNNGRLQSVRRGFDLGQNTVDAIPDLEFVFERLEVDVAGPHLDGIQYQAVDQPDNGGFRGQVFQMLGIRFSVFGDLVYILAGLFDNPFNGLASGAVEPFDRLQNILFLALQDIDAVPVREFKGIDGFRVFRISDGHFHRLAIKGKWNEPGLLHKLHRKIFYGYRLFGIFLI